MKSLQLLSAPAVSIQLGSQNAITLDTVTNAQGKKSFNLNFTTDNDSTADVINDVIDDVKSNVVVDNNSNIHNSIDPLTTILHAAVPIVLFTMTFAYLMFNSYQKRKIKMAMIEKGLTPPDNSSWLKSLFISDQKTETATQHRYLKYMVIAISFGIALVISEIMEKLFDIEIFLGTLAFCLGVGFLYLYKKSPNNNIQ